VSRQAPARAESLSAGPSVSSAAGRGSRAAPGLFRARCCPAVQVRPMCRATVQ